MLTVLIASRNGEKKLAETLQAYCQLEAPSGGWKLVLIDNGSSDQTKAVIESFRSCLPINYLFEAANGKNSALNLGLKSVEGDLVVFTDDDCFPQKDWLVQMRRACDANPSFSIFAGITKPRWSKPPEKWILDWVPMGPVFALSEPMLAEGSIQSGNVFGTNMAIRREVFHTGSQFCVSIGPNGNNYPMGSESELVQRLVRDGYRCWGSPDIVVEHWIGSHQMDRSWILRRAIRFGRGQYRMDGIQANTRELPSWFGVPRFLFRQLLSRTVGVLLSAALFRRKQVFCAQWELNFCWGEIVEAWKIRGTKT